MKQRTILFLVFVCVVFSILVMALREDDNPTLAEQSDRIASLPGDEPAGVGWFQIAPEGGSSYAILDDRHILVRASWPPEAVTTAISVEDVTNGTHRNVAVPASLQQGFIGSVSPDGKWLLWNDNPTRDGQPVAMSLDTGRVVRWQAPVNVESMMWMPDSRRWAAVTSDPVAGYGLAVYSLDTPRVVHAPLVAQAGGRVVGFHGNDRVLVQESSLGTVTWQGTDKKQTFQVDEIDLQHPAIPIVHTVVAPPSYHDDEHWMIVSPGGDRVLWLVPDYGESYWHWMLAGRLNSHRSAITVCVTDLDGHHVKPLGTIDDIYQVSATHLQWCPDGKHFTYIQNNDLYRMAVP